jgi:hypothetical protein
VIYLYTYAMCLIADRSKFITMSGKNTQTIYYVIVLWIYTFLSFGYMTGSDWRGYEIMYMYDDWDKRELGLLYVMEIFKLVTRDFWIFNAFMKILYISSVAFFFKQLVNKVWLAIGLSFTTSILFMVIDCPMRFMVAQTILMFSSYFLFKKQWLKFLLISSISLMFHYVLIIPILIISTLPLSERFSKLNNWLILLMYVTVHSLSFIPNYAEYLYGAAFLMGENISRYAVSYSGFSTEGFFSVGYIKEILLFLIILFFKDKIISSSPHGKMIFYYSCLYFILHGIFRYIPTGFRLNIYAGYYFISALVLILSSRKKIFVYAIYLLFGAILIKDVYSSYKYHPYSNSISYIINGHLPYSERTVHNPSLFNRK